MSKYKIFLKPLFLVFLLIIAFSFSTFIKNIIKPSSSDKMDYWSLQRKGVNIFNVQMTKELFEELDRKNIRLLRLSLDKRQQRNIGEKAPSDQPDFLLQTTNEYNAINEADLLLLRQTLDLAERYQIKVVFTMLSLPGCRWRQLNGGEPDFRIWQNDHYIQQAAKFWQDLARHFRDHPALVAYDFLNEPMPDRFFKNDFSMSKAEKSAATQSLIEKFYQILITAVRKVDDVTPIIVESYDSGSLNALLDFKPIPAKNLIYSVHFYEPFQYTNFRENSGRFVYPGKLTTTDNKFELNKNWLEQQFEKLRAWQSKYKIPSSQIYISEFGANRNSSGVEGYFKDLISIFDRYQWHWSFYSFREDNWHGMDYELGQSADASLRFHSSIFSALHSSILLGPALKKDQITNLIKDEKNYEGEHMQGHIFRSSTGDRFFIKGPIKLTPMILIQMIRDIVASRFARESGLLSVIPSQYLPAEDTASFGFQWGALLSPVAPGMSLEDFGLSHSILHQRARDPLNEAHLSKLYGALKPENKGLTQDLLSYASVHSDLLQILAFDTFVSNSDRSNANILYDSKTSTYTGIDHGEAFSSTFLAQLALTQLESIEPKRLTLAQSAALQVYVAHLESLRQSHSPQKAHAYFEEASVQIFANKNLQPLKLETEILLKRSIEAFKANYASVDQLIKFIKQYTKQQKTSD